MQDKNIVITGGTDGQGRATASRLARMSSRLLLVSRSREKGDVAVSEITSTSGNENVMFLQADLSLMRDVRRTAEHVKQTFSRLDILVHGAGGGFPAKRTLTDEDLEISFAVQYLARFLLTNELLDLLRAAPVPKVVSIAGGASGSKPVDFDNLNGEKSYGKFAAIAMASATNDLLTLEQIVRYPEINFYNYGPGMVRTATISSSRLVLLLLSTIGRPFTRSADQSANDIVKLVMGEYPSGFYGPSLKRNEPTGAEADAAASARLWDHSERMVANLSK